MNRMSITLSQLPLPEVRLGAAVLTPITDGTGRVVDLAIEELVHDGGDLPLPNLLSDAVPPADLPALLERLTAPCSTGVDELVRLEVDGVPHLVRLHAGTHRLLAVWVDCRSREVEEPAVTIDLSESDPPWLSRREIDILELVAEGATTREIAERLYLSVHTIRNHVRRILTKLGARSRSEAVATALSNRLIQLPDPSLRRR